MKKFNEIITTEVFKSGVLDSNTKIEIIDYFTNIKTRYSSGEEYPYDLEELVPVVFSTKPHAVRGINDAGFTQPIDYSVKTRSDADDTAIGGIRKVTQYFLTPLAFEFLVARKNKDIFDIYHRVFHEATKNIDMEEFQTLIMNLNSKLNTQSEALIQVSNQMAVMTNQLQILDTTVKNQKPMVDAFRDFLSANNYLDIEAVVKAISVKYGKIGKNELLKYLRKKQVFTKTNLPYQQYINQKLFDVYIKTYANGQNYSQAVVSPRGLLAIIHSLKRDAVI